MISDNADFSLHVTDVIDLEQLKSYGLPIIIDFGRIPVSLANRWHPY